MAALALVFTPGTAGADDRSHPADVEPIVDCITQHADGSWTAVWGYVNHTGGPVTIPVGPANKITPATLGRPQPESFGSGERHGVFQVTVPRGNALTWHLGPYNVAAANARACPRGTQLPAEGNGMGTVVALGAAGAFGAAVLYRSRRRPARPADDASPSGS
jgi:hypothetical protein